MAEPPLLVGATHVTVTKAFPVVPVTPVGAPGTVVVLVSAVGDLLHAEKRESKPSRMERVLLNRNVRKNIDPASFVRYSECENCSPWTA